jgi:Bacterial regulatory proteins, luxR family
VELPRIADAASFEAAAIGFGMTRRQLDLLRDLRAGLPYRAIGVALGISEHTVAYHSSAILTQADVETVSQRNRLARAAMIRSLTQARRGEARRGEARRGEARRGEARLLAETRGVQLSCALQFIDDRRDQLGGLESTRVWPPFEDPGDDGNQVRTRERQAEPSVIGVR